MTRLHGTVIGPKGVAAANALHHEALACTHDCGGILVSQMSFALPSGNRKVISGIALDPDALKCCSSRSLPGMHKSLSAQAIPRTPRDADDRANRSGCSRRFFPHAGLANLDQSPIDARGLHSLAAWISTPCHGNIPIATGNIDVSVVGVIAI